MAKVTALFHVLEQTKQNMCYNFIKSSQLKDKRQLHRVLPKISLH